jgi:hypothetical protein
LLIVLSLCANIQPDAIGPICDVFGEPSQVESCLTHEGAVVFVLMQWTTFGGIHYAQKEKKTNICMSLFSGSALASIKLIGIVLDYVRPYLCFVALTGQKTALFMT